MATINFQGKPIHTCGELPETGSQAPDFTLVSNKLKEKNLASFKGKKKLLNIVPSLDTPTCQLSTRKFNEKAGALEDTVVLAVSADLPFAQNRFCESEGIKDVIPLSSFRSSFAKDYGVELTDSLLAGLMARAIVIINADNKVVYTELVAEIAEEPVYDQAWEVLKRS